MDHNQIDIENAEENWAVSSPPGQVCKYIPPGNHADERYRLATFEKCPSTSVSVGHLAASGFYYTGIGEIVKCFSCGTTVNGPTCNGPADFKWHSDNCKWMLGQDTFNVPIPIPNAHTILQCITGKRNQVPGFQNSNSSFRAAEHLKIHKEFLAKLNLGSERDRRKSFKEWPFDNCANKLANAGFYYTGDKDRTKCFSCSAVLGNWTQNDDIHEKHRLASPNCRIICGLESGNIPLPEARTSNVTKFSESCSTGPAPYNQCMTSLQLRMASFNPAWPHGQSFLIENIAEAGFFYLGESDKVKCFYCNGGLQNWEQDDDPWTEHAKWFPGCEFVMGAKRLNFAPNMDSPQQVINNIGSSRGSEPQGSPPRGSEPRGSPPTKIKKTTNDTESNESMTDEAEQMGAEGTSVAESMMYTTERCKSCNMQESNAMFSPCGHVGYCEGCAKTTNWCPKCMKKVQSVQKMYRM